MRLTTSPQKQKFYDPRRDGVTQSILSGWLKCRQYAKLSLEGWTSLRTGAALQFGEMAHGVLEHIYGEVRDGRRKVPPTKQEVYKAIGKQVKAWEDSARGRRASGDAVQQLEQNTALLEAVLPHYFTHWAKEDFKDVKWVALEQEFQIPLYGVLTRGKRDGVYAEKGGKIRIFETKTKGQIAEESMSDLLAFDFQSDFYITTYEAETGVLPSGVRYNIIRRPGEKLNKKETLAQLHARVESRVLADPSYYFVRYRIDKTKSDLKVFQGELKDKITEFLAWWDGKLPTYRNETACVGKFGACHFLTVCANGNYSPFYKRERIFEELAAKGGKK